MKTYWCRSGPRHGNFGDRLTPLLLQHFGISCQWASPDRARLAGVGSILEHLGDDFDGVIWTSGFMFEQSRRRFEHARILGVRGKLSRDRISGANADTVLGDAGLLCDLFHTPGGKHFKLGIIPHFVDAGDPAVVSIASDSHDIRVIDICAEPLDVIKAVGECEYILSSSLHGLILADSLGIPNYWIELNRSSDAVIGSGFKFRDYYSIYDMPYPQPRPLGADTRPDDLLQQFESYSRPGIEQIKLALLQMLPEIVRMCPQLDIEDARREAEERRIWDERLEMTRDVLRTLTQDAPVVLADEEHIRHSLSLERVRPFTEREGEYWGPPASDDAAIAEVERLRQEGAGYFVLAWTTFWWMEHYSGLFEYLTGNYRRVLENEYLIAFDVEGVR